MSGGVDSSVAGYLLREQGYDVVGVTMKVWPQDCISRAEDKCCGPQAVADARGVAHALGIPHYVVDEADQFERVVIDYFSSEYQAGRTPNPCVMCNEKLKFGNLWKKAAGARLRLHRDRPLRDHRTSAVAMTRGSAQRRRSAQGSVLFSVQFAAATVAPRADAARRNVEAGDPGDRALVRPEGRGQGGQPGDLFRAGQRLQGVSALASGRRTNFIAAGFTMSTEISSANTTASRCSPSVSAKDLPGGSPRPRYVVDLDPATNRVIVGDAEDLVSEEFEIDRVNWILWPVSPTRGRRPLQSAADRSPSKPR